MLEGFKSLLASEKAIAGGMLIIASTVLVIAGSMTVVDWQAYTRDIFIVYVSGKTVQGAVASWTEAKKAPTVTVDMKAESKTETKTEDIDVTR